MHAQGGKAGDTVASDAPAPAPVTAPKASRFTWVRARADAVPTKWLSTITLGAFLVATAAFGGLNSVEGAGIPELTAGETYTGAGLEITVLGASLVDEDISTGISTLDHPTMQILTVYLDITNLDTETRTVTSAATMEDFYFPPEIDQLTSEGAFLKVRRTDDRRSVHAQLHPGVKAPLMVSWMVPETDYADGDSLRFGLPDATKVVGQTVVDGEFWTDIRPGAYVTVTIEDLGIGTRTEPEEEEE